MGCAVPRSYIEIADEILFVRPRVSCLPRCGHSATLLELGVFRGVAFEKLGRTEEALKAYEQVVAVAIASDGELSEKASNIFRHASLRLARMYRAEL